MSDKPQQEPSIEEILASIRRIISDDAEPGKAAEAGADAPPRPADPPADEPDDVLELTQVVDEEFAPPPLPPPAPPRSPPPSEVHLDLAPEPEPEPEPPPPPPRPRVSESPPGPAGAGLLSAASAAAAATSLSRLTSKRTDSLGQMPVGTRTVEELVMELLRPMLQEWVDDNLPSIVEELVERELRRLSNVSGRE